MKHLLSTFALTLLLVACGPSKNTSNDLAVSTPIVTSINLSAVSNDKVPVIIDPGRFTEENVTYYLPKVVQGTYSVSAFGRFIEDFKALDYNGNPLQFTHPEENTWVISNAKQLDRIEYYVNDTFDQEDEGGIGGEMPFSPAGTNIEPDNYVLNLHGFIGYFDNLKNNQYTLDVTAPATFKHSSALQATATKPNADGTAVTNSYLATRYFDITDNPMMYGDLSIEEFMVGDIKVVLSVFSPNNTHSAADLKPSMFKMMEGQKAYLGDINSTSRYDIFLYLADDTDDAPKGFGALEHHTSTVVVLMDDMSIEQLEESMIDIVSHEFFHIVTPLSLHSEDVHYFDYNNPTFSKHLWMYEGVTEYFAQHFQIYEGLINNDVYYSRITDQIRSSQQFDDNMSFTLMSENILDAPYADNYINVYSKGALIGMCIDILMREESNGQRSMLSLMKELSGRYGMNKPFKDDGLIAEISAMTYPSVASFLKNHVEGTTPIDYQVFFSKVGVITGDKKVKTSYIQDGNGFIFDVDRNNMTLFFSDAVTNNSFWTEQGILSGDVVKQVGGIDFTIENVQSLVENMYAWEPGGNYEIKVERDGKEMRFNGKLTQAYTTAKSLMDDENATSAQKELRKAWLKG